jgi:hypothetical protein
MKNLDHDGAPYNVSMRAAATLGVTSVSTHALELAR